MFKKTLLSAAILSISSVCFATGSTVTFWNQSQQTITVNTANGAAAHIPVGGSQTVDLTQRFTSITDQGGTKLMTFTYVLGSSVDVKVNSPAGIQLKMLPNQIVGCGTNSVTLPSLDSANIHIYNDCPQPQAK